MDFEGRPSKIRKLNDKADWDDGSQDPKATNQAEAVRIFYSDAKENEQNPDVSLNRGSHKEQAQPDHPLSKNQQKKLKRKYDWEAAKSLRKGKRKEKIKEKRARKREACSDGTINGAEVQNSPEGKEKPRFRRSIQLPVTFILDCAFDDLMLDKERVSLSSQVTRSYSDNHHAPWKAHLAVSSFGGNLKERFETVISGQHLSWKGVKFIEEDFVEAADQARGWMQESDLSGGKLSGPFAPFAKECDLLPLDGEVVYLTSDSPNTLLQLKPYSTYIIGGIVDKNRHKGICYKRAMDRKVKTAKLPIGEYMQMASRAVLATNQVVEIMLAWLESGDWGEAFLKVIPKRKGGHLKTDAKASLHSMSSDLSEADAKRELP